MHTKPHTATGQTAHPWLTAEWVYDAIMRHIDEDLTSDALKTHAKKYAKESAEHRAKRKMRYERAYALFEDALSRLDAALVLQTRERRTQQQREMRQMEAGQMDEIEHQISQFPSGK